MSSVHIPRYSLAVFSIAIVLGAHAQSGRNNESEVRYQSERAACALLAEAESRTTCLREAAAARAEGLQRQPDSNDGQYQRNALARCNALPAADQDLCRRRTLEQGTVEGSVASGGIYRKYREITLPDAVAPELNESASGR